MPGRSCTCLTSLKSPGPLTTRSFSTPEHGHSAWLSVSVRLFADHPIGSALPACSLERCGLLCPGSPSGAFLFSFGKLFLLGVSFPVPFSFRLLFETYSAAVNPARAPPEPSLQVNNDVNPLRIESHICDVPSFCFALSSLSLLKSQEVCCCLSHRCCSS